MSAREPSTQQFIRRGIVATAVLAAVVTPRGGQSCSPAATTPRSFFDRRARHAGRRPEGNAGRHARRDGEVCNVDNFAGRLHPHRPVHQDDGDGALTLDTAASFVSRNLFGSDALRLIPAPARAASQRGQR